MSKEFKPCPFCGHSIDIEKDVYNPCLDWHPTLMDPDSGGDPINISCKCGLMFCTGTYDWNEFIEAWNRRDTAYDPDKVVRQLEDRKNLMLETFKISESDIDRGRIYGMDKAIEIVKGGGVE